VLDKFTEPIALQDDKEFAKHRLLGVGFCIRGNKPFLSVKVLRQTADSILRFVTKEGLKMGLKGKAYGYFIKMPKPAMYRKHYRYWPDYDQINLLL
jgi:hypothetical protein